MKIIKPKFQYYLLILPWSFGFVFVITYFNLMLNGKSREFFKIMFNLFMFSLVLYGLLPFAIETYFGINFYFAEQTSWFIYAQAISLILSLYLIQQQKKAMCL